MSIKLLIDSFFSFQVSSKTNTFQVSNKDGARSFAAALGIINVKSSAVDYYKMSAFSKLMIQWKMFGISHSTSSTFDIYPVYIVISIRCNNITILCSSMKNYTSHPSRSVICISWFSCAVILNVKNLHSVFSGLVNYEHLFNANLHNMR